MKNILMFALSLMPIFANASILECKQSVPTQDEIRLTVYQNQNRIVLTEYENGKFVRLENFINIQVTPGAYPGSLVYVSRDKFVALAIEGTSATKANGFVELKSFRIPIVKLDCTVFQ